MAQYTSSNGASFRSASPLRRAFFLPSLGLLSGVSLLVGHDGLAQTPGDAGVAAPVTPQTVTPVPASEPAIAPPPAIPPESFPVEFSTPSAAPVPAVPRSQPPVPIAAPPQTPASEAYIAPSTIIFSERSTGCQTAVQAGQTPNGICGGDTGIRQVKVPGWQGANGQSSAVSAVGIGSLSVVAPSTPLGTTPSLRDFYRRTLRPPGRLGNGNIRLIFPLSIPAPISSIFGWRLHPITGDIRFHSGTDLAAPIGTPVLAAYAGQVALADFLGGYGLTVAINHSKDTQQTLYAHLSEIFVKSGDQVKQGDVIGRVGSTGNSTGPHLHFEFRQLTPEGWVALDAGAQLEYALAQLVNSLDMAQASSAPVKANAGVQGVIQ